MPIRELKIFNRHGRQYVPSLKNAEVVPIFRGRPVIDANISGEEIRRASGLCPVQAINGESGSLDLGKCIFCRECEFEVNGKIRFTNDYRIAANTREMLVVKPGMDTGISPDPEKLNRKIRSFFKHALKLRQVSAAGDNSAEMELNAAGNVNFDMGRYGIEFVASPRHADGIVITGPVSANMAEALKITYEAIPDPKLIILAGTDAISGGIFAGSPALKREFVDQYPIDLYVPGNPPHPLTFIHGIMDLCGRKMK